MKNIIKKITLSSVLILSINSSLLAAGPNCYDLNLKCAGNSIVEATIIDTYKSNFARCPELYNFGSWKYQYSLKIDAEMSQSDALTQLVAEIMASSSSEPTNDSFCTLAGSTFSNYNSCCISEDELPTCEYGELQGSLATGYSCVVDAKCDGQPFTPNPTPITTPDLDPDPLVENGLEPDCTICEFYDADGSWEPCPTETCQGVGVSISATSCILNEGQALLATTPNLDSSYYYPKSGCGIISTIPTPDTDPDSEFVENTLPTTLINGSCGIANNGDYYNSPPTTDMCDNGSSYSNYYDNNVKHYWTCNGVNGGSSIDCSANRISCDESPFPKPNGCYCAVDMSCTSNGYTGFTFSLFTKSLGHNKSSRQDLVVEDGQSSYNLVIDGDNCNKINNANSSTINYTISQPGLTSASTCTFVARWLKLY